MPALPSGVILMWSGSFATIPSGYFLCDGNNGTPDLRERFLLPAGLGVPPGLTGGTLSHTHLFTGDGHSHGMPPGADIQAGVRYQENTSSAPAIGTTNPAYNTPPYYALAFIMKS